MTAVSHNGNQWPGEATANGWIDTQPVCWNWCVFVWNAPHIVQFILLTQRTSAPSAFLWSSPSFTPSIIAACFLKHSRHFLLLYHFTSPVYPTSSTPPLSFTSYVSSSLSLPAFLPHSPLCCDWLLLQQFCPLLSIIFPATQKKHGTTLYEGIEPVNLSAGDNEMILQERKKRPKRRSSVGGAWDCIKTGKQKEVKDPINHLTFHFAMQLLNFELISDHESRVSPLLMPARSRKSKTEALLRIESVLFWKEMIFHPLNQTSGEVGGLKCLYLVQKMIKICFSS